MSKLKVGIVLNQDQLPESGGGYSYYVSLINAIDHFTFSENLDIFFIKFSNKRSHSFNKKCYSIDVSRIKKNDYIYILCWLLTKALRIVSLGFGKRLFINNDSLKNRINRKIEIKLKEYNVELLYYLVPTQTDLNYPYIITSWDLGHKSMYAFPEVSMNNTFVKRNDYHKQVLQHAFAIFAESETGKNELISFEQINHERIYIMPLFAGDIIKLGLSEDQIIANINKYQLAENSFFFYPAQFWSHKNHYNLLIAFKELCKKYENVKLVLTGADKGNLIYIRETIETLEIRDKVIIPGFVTVEELYSFYIRATALVMPTFLGPTNMPLMEAYELGCKVLCSDLAGHKELMGNDATYFNPANAEAIFKCLEDVIEAPSVTKRRVPNGRFSVERSVVCMNDNLSKLSPIRKTFGLNYSQY